MKGTITVIHPNGAFDTRPLHAPPPYETIKAALNGGFLELVPLFTRYDGRDCIAFCDEEGKLNKLPLNAYATALWAAQPDVASLAGDYLAGPVVVIAGDHELLRSL